FVFEPCGPHPVGALDLLTGPASDNGGGVLARLFYPALAAPGAGHPYTEPEYVRGLLAFSNWGSWLSAFLCWGFGRLRLNCAWQAEPLRPAQPLPVIIFSHGLGAQRHIYSSLCLELASRGFLVAAVEHRDGSASMSFDVVDGQRRWLPMEAGQLNDFPRRHAQARWRAGECLQLTEAVLALGRGQPPGLIDPNRVHLMGHSFGAATALTTLATTPEAVYKTCSLLDIWMHPVDPEHYNNVKIPVLFLSNEIFHWEANAQRVQAVLDAIESEEMKANLSIRRIGLADSLHPRDAVLLTARICLAFIARHEGRVDLTEEDRVLLRGEHPDCFPGVKFKPNGGRIGARE
uniref:1-alkyl-2-acetylglycerophosphocholine esterase n=1 Tax=Macrostomum lignano TaxID=282301 RepID=A0A1I8FVD1_9PLAT